MASVGVCLSIVNLRVIFAEKDRSSIHCWEPVAFCLLLYGVDDVV